MDRLLTYLLVMGLLFGVAACTPSLSPLYRDYQADPPETAVRDSIRAALRTAGWELAPEAAPGVVTTAPRTIQQWGLYRVEVSLEALPMSGQHVRLLIHPYRRYVTGHRSKMPYLPGGVQRAILPDLNDAFTDRGLMALETPRERDRRLIQ